jgi:hypothetical protein
MTIRQRPAMSKHAQILISLMVMALLFGCNDDNLAEMARADSDPGASRQILSINHGKPGAPISVEYQMPTILEVGQPFELTLRIDSSTDTGRLDLELSDEGEMKLLGPNRFQFDLSTQPHTVEVRVLLNTREGGYLNMSFMEYDEEGKRTAGRSLSLPLSANEAQMKTVDEETRKEAIVRPEQLLRDEREKIIEIPATER